MKSKKLSKKLTFNKSTIANLDSKEMTGAYAGGPIETKYITQCRTRCIETECASCDLTCPLDC